MHDWKDYLRPFSGPPYMVEEWPPGNEAGPYFTIALCAGIEEAIAVYDIVTKKHTGRRIMLKQQLVFSGKACGERLMAFLAEH